MLVTKNALSKQKQTGFFHLVRHNKKILASCIVSPELQKKYCKLLSEKSFISGKFQNRWIIKLLASFQGLTELVVNTRFPPAMSQLSM